MYKGDLEGFPQEIVEKMLDEQERQGNKRDVSVFEKNKCSPSSCGGFDWHNASQGYSFWELIIYYGGVKYFYDKFPRIVQPTISQQVEKLHQPFMSTEEQRGFDVCKKLVLNLLNKVNE